MLRAALGTRWENSSCRVDSPTSRCRRRRHSRLVVARNRREIGVTSTKSRRVGSMRGLGLVFRAMPTGPNWSLQLDSLDAQYSDVPGSCENVLPNLRPRVVYR